MEMSERDQLARLVQQWNENRLDLFHLTEPTEDLEIQGVMRFYFQDVGEKVSTKCIRVSSTATTRAVIDALIEKFLPDLRMLSDPEYSLWEVHEGGEERKLDLEEKPLLVQLTWHKDDREGRFLLKKHGNQYLPLSALQLHDERDSNIKRSLKRFSKREKKEIKKKHQQGIVTVNAGREEECFQPDIYKQVPTTTFTRTISNPEIVMKKRRERKLEAKLSDMGYQAGSLKVYGGDLVPARPYVTLLVAMHDRAEQILRDSLEKYGLDHLSLDDYVLVESVTPPDVRRSLTDLHAMSATPDRIVDLGECPLINIANRAPHAPELFYSIRRRPGHYNRISSVLSDASRSPAQTPSRAIDPAFLMLNPDGSVNGSDRFLAIMPGITEVGSDRTLAQFSQQNIFLRGAYVRERHCVITFEDGVVTITPSATDALIDLNGRRITQTAILNDGDIIRVGSDCMMRYVVSKSRFVALRPTNFTNYEALSSPQIRLSGSSLASSSRHPSDHMEMRNGNGASQSVYHVPSASGVPPQQPSASAVPQGPPMSIQVGDYRVWDFLSEVLSRGCEEASSFRLSPAFALYLALRFFHSHQKPYLVQFMTRIASQIAQKSQECDTPSELLFWLANASELSFLVDSDCELSKLAQQRGGSIGPCVERVLRRLVLVLRKQLEAGAGPMLDENVDDEQAARAVLVVLDSAIREARQCRLNAALTIQMSSQLFHSLNATLFNALVKNQNVHLCRTLGERLAARLRYIYEWAERNGLELAAECHLDRIQQASAFLASPKHDVEEMGATCYKLNSIQVQHLFSRYKITENEPPVDDEVISAVVRLAERHADHTAQQEGHPITLDESETLALPFLLPQDGYAAEQLRGAPEGLLAFVLKLQQKGLCHSVATLDSRSSWLVREPVIQQMQPHYDPVVPHTAPTNAPNGMGGSIHSLQTSNFGDSFGSSAGAASLHSTHGGDEVVRIHLRRGPKGIGLSIVAAQGVGDRQVGIYVKKVVEGGPAASDGRLSAGDQLLSVNGQQLLNISQEDAAGLMARSGQDVIFEVRKGAALSNGLAAWLCQTTPVSPPVSNGLQQQTFHHAHHQPAPFEAHDFHQANYAQLNKSNTVGHSAGNAFTQRLASGGSRTPASTYPSQPPSDPAPRHQRSISASDLYQSQNDPNTSFSQRSICSNASGFAPAPGGQRQLPAHYRPRPTVIQPGRASSGAQSPSALRRGAASPTALYRPPSESALHRPPSSSNLAPTPVVVQTRPVERPTQLPPQTPSAIRHIDMPSTSQGPPSVPQRQNGTTHAPVFRASSHTQLYHSDQPHDAPPVAQSSPRQQVSARYDYEAVAAEIPRSFAPAAHVLPRDGPSLDQYANLPLHTSHSTSPPAESHYRSIREFERQSLPFSYTAGTVLPPPVSIRPKEPAIVRPHEQQLRSPDANRTTTFGVVHGAVPTPISHVLQQGGHPLKNLRAPNGSDLDRDVRNLEQMNRQDLSAELDRLDAKGINMTEAETTRYRQLLDISAEKSRSGGPSAAGPPPLIRPVPVRHETVIDDVTTTVRQNQMTSTFGSPLQENGSPRRRVQISESIDAREDDFLESPSIVGSHEVYRDPRTRRLNEIQAQQIGSPVDGARLGFQDKMRLFALQIGEATPKDRSKESSAQRFIERTD